MVDEESHTVLLMNDCRILKQKNPLEETDVKSSKKREYQTRQQPQWLPSERCLFLLKDSNTRKQHVENISQMYDKNS